LEVELLSFLTFEDSGELHSPAVCLWGDVPTHKQAAGRSQVRSGWSMMRKRCLPCRESNHDSAVALLII